MICTVAERKIRCPSFELKEQVLLAEVAPIRVIKLNGFHLQRVEIKKLHLKAVIQRPLHGFRCLFRRNVRASNGEKFDGVSQILGCKAQETAVQTAGKAIASRLSGAILESTFSSRDRRGSLIKAFS